MTTLEILGKRIVAKVREETISDWKSILNGTMKGDRATAIRASIADGQRDVIESIVPYVVDSVLHNLLTWVESDALFSLCAREHGSFKPMEDVSDGLAGELYGTNGWIAKYGQCKGSAPPKNSHQ